MTSVTWGAVLQNVQPNAGFQPLDPGTYRFRILSGAGKTAQTGKQMVTVQLEVISEFKKGRKVWHQWVLPNQHDDKAEQSMGFFLGDMLAFGITKEWLIATFGAQEISKEHCDFIGQQLVNRQCKATATLQKTDASRNNFGSFTEDDGVDPPAPQAKPTAGSLLGGVAPPPAMPGVTPPMPGAAPVAYGSPAGLPPAPGPVASAPAYAQPPQAPMAPAPMAAAPGVPMPGQAPAFQPPQGLPPQAAPAAPLAPPQAPQVAPAAFAQPQAAAPQAAAPAAPQASF